MWFFSLFIIAALLHQMSIELDLPVLSPGGLNADGPPFVPQGFEPGVRVAKLSSQVGDSAMHSHAPTKTCTRANEVWAMFGYDQLVHQSRISVHFVGHANVHYKLDTLATMADASQNPTCHFDCEVL